MKYIKNLILFNYFLILNYNLPVLFFKLKMGIGDWGLVIGDW